MGLAATGTPDAEARTILIVEDERIVARDLCMTLEEMGYANQPHADEPSDQGAAKSFDRAFAISKSVTEPSSFRR